LFFAEQQSFHEIACIYGTPSRDEQFSGRVVERHVSVRFAEIRA
jgi:hypothetical protein